MIRHAKDSDLDAIVTIYNQAVLRKFATADLDPVRVDDRRNWFHAHSSTGFPIFVFEQNDRIVGWCSVDPYRSGRRALARTGEIAYYVDYDFHRHGIATKLVEYMLERVAQLGKRILFAIVLESNKPSISLLKKFGFEKWGHLPHVADIDGKLISHVYYGKKLADIQADAST